MIVDRQALGRTAIVCCGGGFQGLPAIRALKDIGWRTIVIDSISHNINRFEADCYYVAPELSELEVFQSFLLRVIERENATAVFPSTMYDLHVIANMSEEIKKAGAQVFVSPPSLLTILSDKEKVLNAAIEQGIAVLPLVNPETHDFSCELIGKNRKSWGGQGLKTIISKYQYDSLGFDRLKSEYIWQEKLLNFREWSVDFAISPTGEMSNLVLRERVRSSSGYSVVSKVCSPDNVVIEATKVVNWLAGAGARGWLNIQFLESWSGDVWLNDVNPRPGTSSTAALHSDINLAAFLLNETESIGSKKAAHGLHIRSLTDTFYSSYIQGSSGIVFDLDDTLIDHKSWMLSKLNIVCERILSVLGDDAVNAFRYESIRIIDEGPWDRLIDVAISRSGIRPDYRDTLILEWQCAHPETIEVYSEVPFLISQLQSIGIKSAIVTDNPVNSQKQKIERLDFSEYFSTIVFTNEIGKPKPDCAGFLMAAEKMNLNPSQLTYVGDSPWKDALGALRAGYRSVVLLQRKGAMHNSMRSVFEQNYPEFAHKISWVQSLAGIDALLENNF